MWRDQPICLVLHANISKIMNGWSFCLPFLPRPRPERKKRACCAYPNTRAALRTVVMQQRFLLIYMQRRALRLCNSTQSRSNLLSLIEVQHVSTTSVKPDTALIYCIYLWKPEGSAALTEPGCFKKRGKSPERFMLLWYALIVTEREKTKTAETLIPAQNRQWMMGLVTDKTQAHDREGGGQTTHLKLSKTTVHHGRKTNHSS